MRYREVEPSSERRKHADALLAHGLLAIELRAVPLAVRAAAARRGSGSGRRCSTRPGTSPPGIGTILLGCLASLMLTMALAKRVDHAWKLVRRAAGHRQERGALERIFAASVGIALVVFTFWFFVIQGPGPTLAPAS